MARSWSPPVSDVNSIQPGQKFRIGVLYRIDPGWHIYWKYPGDAGIPTKIAWQLPEGFKVRDLQWPIPTREKEPGDLEVFAYSSEVLLFAIGAGHSKVYRPDRLRFGPNQTGWIARISASQLSLKINASVNAPSQSAPIFEKYTAQLPKTLPAALKIRLWPVPHSHGCIRLHPSAAPKFFALVHQGTPVDIASLNPRIRPLGKTSPARPITNIQIPPEATWSRVLFLPSHKGHCCRISSSR
jgi:hypothetical protein